MTLKLDPKNARKHSDLNKKRIRQSLEAVGAGRSILVDADGIIRAGNGVYEQAQALGLPVKIVESDGTELIAVQRKDLSGKDAIRAAALDNIAADSSAYDYDAAILAEIAKDDELVAAIAKEDAKLTEMLRQPEVLGWGDAAGGLPTGDRAPFQQMTFTLHDSQAEQVKEALSAAKGMGAFVDSPNENSNGNALARICEIFVTEHGNG